MVSHVSFLVTLVTLIDRLPLPLSSSRRGRGRPQIFSDHLFLKALVIMIVHHLHSIHELLTVFAQPTAEMTEL